MFPLALGFEEIFAPYLQSDNAVHVAAATIKTVVTAVALIVAIYVPSFSFLCALVGMICTMTVSVVFPAAAHLRMFGPKLNVYDKFLDVVFVILGVAMAVVGTYYTIV